MHMNGSLIAQLGHIGQLGFVCKDLHVAVDFWTGSLGAGPFYELSHIVQSGTRFRGQSSDVDLSAALGYFGDVQIELIQQHCDAPSIYREWIEQNRTGVQHYAVLVDDFASAHAALVRAGGTPIQETAIPGSVEAAYFEIPGQEPIIEILDLSPTFAAQWARMKSEAIGWNGERPLRPFAELG
jgi:hypothetical protein